MKLLVVTILPFLTILSCSNSRQVENDKSAALTSALEKSPAIQQKRIAIIYRSVDGGFSWVPFDKGIPGDATVSAFLIVDDRTFATTDHNGIYSVQDGQSEWKRIDENLPYGIDINAISIIDNVLIIGTLRHGVLVSKDNGKNWSYPAHQVNSPVRCIHARENVLFAGADNGIYKSLDNGNTWTHIWEGVQVNGFTEMNDTVYAALMNGAASTKDEGKNWTYIYEPHTLHDISTDGLRIYAMTLGDGLKKSENGGLTWEHANAGLGTRNLYTFEVKRFAGRLYAAQWHGIYTSDNWGMNWSLIRNGLPDSIPFTTLETTKNGLIAGIGLRKK